MWSYWLRKIKKSITNSKPIAEVVLHESPLKVKKQFPQWDQSAKIRRWQYLAELFIASYILALLLSLAEAQAWSNLQFEQLLKYVLYINWIVLLYVALMDIYHRKSRDLRSRVTLIVGFFCLQGCIILSSVALNILLYWGAQLSFKNLSWQIVGQNLSINLSYGLLLGSLCLRYSYIREQWLKQKQAELKARIQALQARIHPHFLFNSLNTVVSLIAVDAEKAEKTLIDFAQLFRASLQETKLVSLEEEIGFCKNYLAIQEIRLGSKLQVEWKIQQSLALMQIPIPLLTLQPLLENSIFHGVEQHQTASKVNILIESCNKQVTIVITNPILKDRIKNREGQGLALENIQQRLTAYFGSDAILRHYSSNAVFTTVLQYRYT